MLLRDDTSVFQLIQGRRNRNRTEKNADFQISFFADVRVVLVSDSRRILMAIAPKAKNLGFATSDSPFFVIELLSEFQQVSRKRKSVCRAGENRIRTLVP